MCGEVYLHNLLKVGEGHELLIIIGAFHIVLKERSLNGKNYFIVMIDKMFQY